MRIHSKSFDRNFEYTIAANSQSITGGTWRQPKILYFPDRLNFSSLNSESGIVVALAVGFAT